MIWDERGWGYLAAEHPRTDFFQEYRAKDETEMGRKLIASRLALLRQYVLDDESVIDVGIGGGGFILARQGCSFGTDVDPEAIAWLTEKGWLASSQQVAEAMCFWDSFEHIEDPAAMVRRHGPTFVLMSIPIFPDREGALQSKHYKPGEHLWYFTISGLDRFMDDIGYRRCHLSNAEGLLGREGISTCVYACLT